MRLGRGKKEETHGHCTRYGRCRFAFALPAAFGQVNHGRLAASADGCPTATVERTNDSLDETRTADLSFSHQRTTPNTSLARRRLALSFLNPSPSLNSFHSHLCASLITGHFGGRHWITSNKRFYTGALNLSRLIPHSPFGWTFISLRGAPRYCSLHYDSSTA